MNTKHLLLLGLPGTALVGLGLSHANPSGIPACPPVGETATPAGLVFGDVDGDGLDDAFVVGADGQARLLMNFGEGRFEDVTLAANLAELGGATCALFADLDGDGRLDLFAGSSEQRLWRNLGNATFEPMASGIEHDLVDLAAQAVDHDQDGRLDLQIHTEAGDLVYRNLGEGRFERLALPLGELPQAPTHVGWIAPDSVDATDPLAAPDAGTPAQRRLGRWVQGRAVGGFASAATSAPAGASSFGPSLPFLATCQPGVRDANGSACIGASSVATLGKLYPLSTKLFVDDDSGSWTNIGMGTTSPDNIGVLTLRANNGFGDMIYMRDVNDQDKWHMKLAGGGLEFVETGVAGGRLFLDDGGNVGIGTTTPGQKLTVKEGSLEVDLPDIGATSPNGSKILLTTPGGRPGIYIVKGDGAGGAVKFWGLVADNNNNFVISDSTVGSLTRLSIDSAGLVSVKQSLEIRGGADIVERFESSCGPLEPGTVVAIDPENPGQLACSFDAYDTKVAGVVSGAGGVKPGICLGQDGVLDGETPVAMTGRVYVKCSTENGAIRPGDRLTTAERRLAGHAMKVTDEQRSVGAVIGKAMSALDEGTGLVLVLVNLQ